MAQPQAWGTLHGRPADVKGEDRGLLLVIVPQVKRQAGPVTLPEAVKGDARDFYTEQAKQRMVSGKGEDGSGGRGKKKNPETTVSQGKRGPRARDMAGAAVGQGHTLQSLSRIPQNRVIRCRAGSENCRKKVRACGIGISDSQGR